MPAVCRGDSVDEDVVEEVTVVDDILIGVPPKVEVIKTVEEVETETGSSNNVLVVSVAPVVLV